MQLVLESLDGGPEILRLVGVQVGEQAQAQGEGGDPQRRTVVQTALQVAASGPLALGHSPEARDVVTGRGVEHGRRGVEGHAASLAVASDRSQGVAPPRG